MLLVDTSAPNVHFTDDFAYYTLTTRVVDDVQCREESLMFSKEEVDEDGDGR